MNTDSITSEPKLKPLNWKQAVLLLLGATACFHIAYTPAHPGPLALFIVGYVASVVQLARLRTTRQSFYGGLITGFLCYAPQLECFWRIFGPGAVALWAVLAFWLALFVALAHVSLTRFGMIRAALLIPFLWTGLEYFRSELYYLKFSWLNAGYAFEPHPFIPLNLLGLYGIGFFVSIYAALFFVARTSRIIIWSLIVLILGAIIVPFFAPVQIGNSFQKLHLAAVQLEFPMDDQIKRALDKVVATRTNLDLIVLSEYTLDSPPSQQLKDWCRDNQKFLIVGGKDPAGENNFYDTAFVINTNGEIIFKQAKAVPIQFFKDGLPAREQKLWNSPWGKIGICICYDLSYSRVTDELIRQGAQMLIVPTMDVVDWGRHEHELHARVAPVRAAEYGIPIFRVASSGISQGVSSSGCVSANASFPGEGEMLFFGVNLKREGSLPLDRYLAPASVCVTAVFVVWLAVTARKKRTVQITAPQTPA